jgi:hypothetical protein
MSRIMFNYGTGFFLMIFWVLILLNGGKVIFWHNFDYFYKIRKRY